MADWRDREVANQIIFREMNEWNDEARNAGSDPGSSSRNTYLCECSDGRCTEPISLTRREYQAVRSVPVRFAIAVDHENPEIDSLVAENERFAMVDKFYGLGVRIARATDPRR